MFEHFAYHVKNLHRESIGFLNLNGIERGKYRLLSQEEVEKIKKMCKENKKKKFEEIAKKRFKKG